MKQKQELGNKWEGKGAALNRKQNLTTSRKVKRGNSSVRLPPIPSQGHWQHSPCVEMSNLLSGILVHFKKDIHYWSPDSSLPVFLTIRCIQGGIFIHTILLNTFLSTKTEFKSIHNIFHYSNNTLIINYKLTKSLYLL